MNDGHIYIRSGGDRYYEHVKIAEKALGKKLPAGAVVHHLDENPSNNDPRNLVICPSEKYHKLLHHRTLKLSLKNRS